MKLLELEIRNVRGIRELVLKPDGRNIVIYGPNGSGKSAVIDAIDFLLTGRVARLTGRGTKGITLRKYGPHIDCGPEDAVVRATIRLTGVEVPVKIERCLAHPSRLEYDQAHAQRVAQVVNLAGRGQHVLTRRDILKFIQSEAGTRAQEIQQLLNISEVEATRRALVGVQHDIETAHHTSVQYLERAQSTVNATAQTECFSEEDTLQVVNKNRAVLGGDAIQTLLSSRLKEGLNPPGQISGGEADVNVILVERHISSLLGMTSTESQEKIAAVDGQVRVLLSTIRSDPQMSHELSRRHLTKIGLKLLDQVGNCPLCDTPFPPGTLHEIFEKRLSTASLAAQHQGQIDQLVSVLVETADNASASIREVVAAAQRLELVEEVPVLQNWLDHLQGLIGVLASAMDKLLDSPFSNDQVQRMLATAETSESLSRTMLAVRQKCPAATPQQAAWDVLTRLEENLKVLEQAKVETDSLDLSRQRAVLLLQFFEEARDAVLGRLYDDVRNRFESLYRQLHGADEAGFTVKIEPKGAMLDLEVDFYGRGTHPPHALHSEGHQDSMGICLYLALAERLTEGVIDLVMLDDVVMSVDSEHRRALCRVFANAFPTRQFLITTHDRTWLNQLRSQSVVDSKGIVEFYNWDIKTGPQVSWEPEMWKSIANDLQRSDVPSAAAHLRRGSEGFFSIVCDALEAPVAFNLEGQWELGHLLHAAMNRYRDLLKKAKDAANSWNRRSEVANYQEMESVAGQIFARTQAEQWAVNANVHYNNWCNFAKEDFEPVVEAFQDLCALFVCSSCSTILRVVTSKVDPEAVRCNCGEVNWNLIRKA